MPRQLRRPAGRPSVREQPAPGGQMHRPDGPGHPAPGRRPLRKDRWQVPRAQSAQDDSLPLLVHQLAGLLAAGRSPGSLWADAASLCRAEAEAGDVPQARADVLAAASRAARLGLSVVPVLQDAASTAGRRRPGALILRSGRRSGEVSTEARFWRDLAACVHVAEASGAPLAELLHRYAEALEADLDAQAARDGVLAGPQATVRLLAWLPVGGLGLGYALGADPLGTLLASGFGWAVLAAAAALTVAGRVWSRRLVASAAGTAPQ